MQGLFKPRGTRADADGVAGIAKSECHDRPAIIGAWHQKIDFIAALGPMLVQPHFTAGRVQRQTLWVAMAIGKYRGQRTRLPHKGVVRRDAAIIVQAQHRTVIVGEALGLPGPVSLACGHEELSIPAEGQPGTEMTAAGPRIVSDMDRFHICKRGSGQTRPRDGRSCAVRCGRRIGKIDPAICFVLRVQHHIEQTALTFGENIRQPRERVRDRAFL